MVASLKDVITRSTMAFFEDEGDGDGQAPPSEDSFAKWVLDWPGQAMVTARMINWTAEAVNAIQAGTLDSFLDSWNRQLSEIVTLVRQG